ncbi:MAG: hypothetical protein RIK87_14715 [Fuerstiella sp.]
MARVSRGEVFDPAEVAVVHVMNRTTRRCFLLGKDPLTGKNFDHRKQWIEDRLRLLAGWFGIDLLCQAILSNHFHLVLRSRPDVVAEWDDTEVAKRWMMLCPKRKDDEGKAKEPTESELNSIRLNPDKLKDIRRRLSDISWWMRLLSQNIAQRANREEGEVGKFWQARFRGVRLVDETAILACAAYIDLNPIRATLAETLEDSHFTSVQKRIRDLQRKQCLAHDRPTDRHDSAAVADSTRLEKDHATSAADRSPSEAGDESGYLAPLELNERTSKPGSSRHQHSRRCSDKGFLPMTMADYLDLLNWTISQMHTKRPDSPPASAVPIFERLQINANVWLRLVKDFGRLFSVMAGQPRAIDGCRSRDGSRRFRARRKARELMSAV